MNRLTIPAKSPLETIEQQFDFASLFTSGATISSVSATAAVYSGADSTPSSVIGTVTSSGTVATVPLKAGVDGVIYLITVQATSISSDVSVIQAFLAVVASLA